MRIFMLALFTTLAAADTCAAGCATQGVLDAHAAATPVAFVWNSTDGRHDGEIATTLPSGEAFTGEYRQIITEAPFGDDSWFAGWYEGWETTARFPEPWPYAAFDEPATPYSPTVIALLAGNRGDKMRCHFTLDDPGLGLAGGMAGRCQLASGATIDAALEE